MRRPFSAVLVLAVAAICAVMSAPLGQTAYAGTTSDGAPAKNAAYFEAGPYWEFALIQKHIIAALDRRGLANRIVFPERLHVSPGWDASESDYRRAARKLMDDPSVDVIVSMGTAASKALLAENNGKTPIMSVDVADPVGAGIVDPKTGLSVPNLTIQYNKDKWFKVFTMFHEAIPFRRMGIMYHDSPEGLSYSNVREAREVARERGFTLVEYPHLDKAESAETCARGIDWLLAKGIDAFYVSALNCFDWTRESPQPLFDKLNAHAIKTFARDGSVHVRHGVLMGLSTLDYAPLGKFYADRMAAKLGLLPPQANLEKSVYTPKIALNLVTANKLGIDFPMFLLISADELFDSTLSDVHKADKAQ